jgi:hypothetical protein
MMRRLTLPLRRTLMLGRLPQAAQLLQALPCRPLPYM